MARKNLSSVKAAIGTLQNKMSSEFVDSEKLTLTYAGHQCLLSRRSHLASTMVSALHYLESMVLESRLHLKV